MPATHTYTHDKGFGEHHAGEAGRELPAEMRDLDMARGTEVEHEGTDSERGGLEIVSWADLSGTPRRTSVEPDFFAAHFTALAHAELAPGTASQAGEGL